MAADFEGLIAAGQVHVAQEAGEMLGFIVSHPHGDGFLLENVAVCTAATGRGIGKRLIGFCEDEATRAGRRASRSIPMPG